MVPIETYLSSNGQEIAIVQYFENCIRLTIFTPYGPQDHWTFNNETELFTVIGYPYFYKSEKAKRMLDEWAISETFAKGLENILYLSAYHTLLNINRDMIRVIDDAPSWKDGLKLALKFCKELGVKPW